MRCPPACLPALESGFQCGICTVPYSFMYRADGPGAMHGREMYQGPCRPNGGNVMQGNVMRGNVMRGNVIEVTARVTREKHSVFLRTPASRLRLKACGRLGYSWIPGDKFIHAG